MKNLLPFLILFTLILTDRAYSQKKVDSLNNESIIQLTKMGLQPSVIVIKINSSVNNFDVSTDGLVNLSTNGVSADVINEMIKYESNKQQAIANIKDLNDPLTPRSSGVYYYNPDNKEKSLTRVDPTVMGGNKAGGFGAAMASSMTYGLSSSSVKSILAGNTSNLQINENRPVFYFYFDDGEKFNRENWFFASATSPNEFVLVHLDQKKDRREMVIGKENAYGSSSGIPDKNKVKFNYSEVAPGIYKVTFDDFPINKGEYCFTYASSNPNRYSNDKVFDFCIIPALPIKKK